MVYKFQGTFGPKVKGTIKEEISLDGINTWKVIHSKVRS